MYSEPLCYYAVADPECSRRAPPPRSGSLKNRPYLGRCYRTLHLRPQISFFSRGSMPRAPLEHTRLVCINFWKNRRLPPRLSIPGSATVIKRDFLWKRVLVKRPYAWINYVTFFLKKNSKELGRETEKTLVTDSAWRKTHTSACVRALIPCVCHHAHQNYIVVFFLITTPARFCDSWKSTLLLFELSSTTLHSFETGIADENSNLNRRKMISVHEN